MFFNNLNVGNENRIWIWIVISRTSGNKVLFSWVLVFPVIRGDNCQGCAQALCFWLFFFFPKHSYTLHLCYKLGEIVSFSSRVESKYWLLGWVPKPSNSLKRAEPLKGPVETLALPPPLLWRPLNSWPLLASGDCFLLSVLLHLGLYQTLSIIPPTESSLTRSGCNTHVPVCLGFGVEREIRLQPKGAHTWDWIAETLN